MKMPLGYALLRDRRVPIRAKLIALGAGAAVVTIIELLQIPFETTAVVPRKFPSFPRLNSFLEVSCFLPTESRSMTSATSKRAWLAFARSSDLRGHLVPGRTGTS